MHDSALNIKLAQVNGSAFLEVAGDIDAESAVELRDVLESLHLDKQVVIDMAGVEFMDSSGIKVLLDRMVRIRAGGGSVCISRPSRQVRRVVEITGLAEVLLAAHDD